MTNDPQDRSMPPRPHRFVGVLALVTLCGAGGLSAAGCRGASDMGTIRLTDRPGADRGRAAAVSIDAFRADEPRQSTNQATAGPGLPTRSPEMAEQGIAGVEAVVGAPEPAPVRARPPQSRGGEQREVLVDQVVGQINGEPVFAAAFFEPMDTRLRAQASRIENDRQAREFIESMIAEISRQLVDQMQSQLLLDEFRATLTAEERVGITALIERIQTDLQRGAFGSRELADRQLRAAEGRGLDEHSRHLSDEVFIGEHLRRTISNRVSVSSRDVRQEYQRRWAEFNPPPIARLRVVRVPTESAGAVAEALRSGRSFQQVAAEYSRWRPEADNLIETTLGEGGVGEAEFFGIAALNDPARSLSVGQSIGPIEVGTSSWWLRLDEIHQPPGIPLYEAQIQINDELHQQRRADERRRYFEELLKRSNFSDREEMVAKLTAFGAQRYLGITIPDTPRPGDAPQRSR